MRNDERIRIVVFVVLMLSMLLWSCQASTEIPSQDNGETPEPEQPVLPAGSQVLKSELPRVTAPDVSVAQMDELAAGNRAFAVDFYQAVRGQDGNLFYSPYSLSVALAMTYAGARAETAAQMDETMHYTLPQEDLHSAFNALDLDLGSREIEPVGEDNLQPFRLNIANSLWGQYDYDFLPEFIDLLARNYGAGLRLVDFVTAPEAARQEINRWVEDETQEKIKNLIPEGAIDDLTRLVLANAIYFKADWLKPFEKELTKDLPFYSLDGSQVQTPMMSHDDPIRMRYLQGEAYQAFELPYVGEQVAMLVIVPNQGRFEDFELGLDAAGLETIIEAMAPRMVKLTMPKFSFESEFQLAQTLIEMGMPDAFDYQLADFSGMDGTDKLYIGDVFHKAFVAVDEKGTEAAAATAVIMKLEAAIMSDVQLTVDRPFIFMIIDKPSGTILFLGRVLNPTG